MSAGNNILTASSVDTVAAESNPLTRRIRAFVTLAKPEITMMVMLSAGFASLMASGSLQITLVNTVVGIGLLASGAAALNQFLERKLDGRMRRTAKRPLPAGDLTAPQALIFGVVSSVCGLLYMFLFLNVLTAVLGLLTLISYLGLYTPLKTRTALCTFVGAFPGAAPVLIGWSATTNSLSAEAWVLYAILFLWQFPHFYAIGWLYREDYARVGMRMLPSLNGDDERITFRLILLTTQLLILASLLMPLIANTGAFYFVTAITLDLAFFYVVYQTSLERSKAAAKRLLHASVIYLPLLYLALLLDRISL
jgi:protoheme IX farnesyltransferase